MSGQPPEPGEYVGKHIMPGSYGPLVTPADQGRPWRPPEGQAGPQPVQGAPHGPSSPYDPPSPYGPPPPWEQQRPPGDPWRSAHGSGPGAGVPPKNAVLSLIVSFIVPGLGTMLNGEVTKGAAILGAYLLSIVLTVTLAFVVVGLVFFPVALGIWVFGLVDAYRGANKFNAAHGLVSPW